MDIKTLKYFLAVAEKENISKAAEKLCMAQPPLSRQMRQLEEELGVPLFVRGRRKTQLTDEGQFLKQRAEEIILLLERTQQQISLMGEQTGGMISIAATEVSGASILAEMIEEFHRIHPNICFQIWAGNSEEVSDRLEKNLADIGMVREPFGLEAFEFMYLKSECWTAVMNRKNPLADQFSEEIPLHLLEEEPLMIPGRQPIRDEINNWFNEIAADRHIFCYYNAITSVLGLVERNLGTAICPQSVQSFMNREELRCVKIVQPEHESGLYLVRRRHQILSSPAEYFWRFSSNRI